MLAMANSTECTTQVCRDLAQQFRMSMSPKYKYVDKCDDWFDMACGGFEEQQKMPEHRNIITTMTNMQDEVDSIVRGFLTRPYVEVSQSLPDSELRLEGSADVDRENLELVTRYYSGCMSYTRDEHKEIHFLELMEEVHRAFAKLDGTVPFRSNDNVTTYQPAVDTTEELELTDAFMIRDAQINLAQYRIFPFAKFTLQQSLIDPTKTAIVVTPHDETVVPEEVLFGNIDNIWPVYGQTQALFLEHAHGPHVERVQDINALPDNLLKLERDLLKIHLGYRSKALIKHHVQEMSMTELKKMSPLLRLHEVIQSHPRPNNITIDSVEVAFPEYFEGLEKTLKGRTKETVRSYMLFQAFIQTQELWDMDWAKTYNAHTMEWWGKPENATASEKCLKRTQRHFGHILDSFYIRKEYSPQHTEAVREMAGSIRNHWRGMLVDTAWMSPQGLTFSTLKLDSLNISIGYPKSPNVLRPESLAEFYSGTEVRSGKNTTQWEDNTTEYVYSLRRPERWTHLHDYFNLEGWHVNRTWSQLSKPPRSAGEWPINAHSQEPYYSPQHNQLIIPAGIMRKPVFGLGAPGWVNYGGLGTFMGHHMMKAFNGIGQQYQNNGSIRGDTWTKSDWEQYNKQLGCLGWRWDSIAYNQGRMLIQDISNTFEAVLGDIFGMEAAHLAWRGTQDLGKDKHLPGLGKLKLQHLYWVARTLPFCGKSDSSGDRERAILYAETPPYFKRATEPLVDYSYWMSAYKCDDCIKCFYKTCRTFGSEPNSKRIGDVYKKFDE